MFNFKTLDFQIVQV